MNIFNFPTLPLPEELTTMLVESKNIRIERIISTGQVSGWYNQAAKTTCGHKQNTRLKKKIFV